MREAECRANGGSEQDEKSREQEDSWGERGDRGIKENISRRVTSSQRVVLC